MNRRTFVTLIPALGAISALFKCQAKQPSVDWKPLPDRMGKYMVHVVEGGKAAYVGVRAASPIYKVHISTKIGSFIELERHSPMQLLQQVWTAIPNWYIYEYRFDGFDIGEVCYWRLTPLWKGEQFNPSDIQVRAL